VSMAATTTEFAAALAGLGQWRPDALLLGGAPFFSSRRQQIVALTARDAIPAMYANREFVQEGGLMSYGNDVADGYRRAALHVARILKGEKPANLPIDQATKFEFVINLKTAKTLGLEVPPELSAHADAVIESPQCVLHLLRSPSGTKRTCRHAATMSALGAKPDDICSLRAFERSSGASIGPAYRP